MDFLKVAGEIPIKTEVKIFPLEDANQALQMLKAGKFQGAGTLRI
jgi:propanol-preferring alcohol dehydrogenase